MATPPRANHREVRVDIIDRDNGQLAAPGINRRAMSLQREFGSRLREVHEAQILYNALMRHFKGEGIARSDSEVEGSLAEIRRLL